MSFRCAGSKLKFRFGTFVIAFASLRHCLLTKLSAINPPFSAAVPKREASNEMQNDAVLLILPGRKYKMYCLRCNCDANERLLVRIARINFGVLIGISFCVLNLLCSIISRIGVKLYNARDSEYIQCWIWVFAMRFHDDGDVHWSGLFIHSEVAPHLSWRASLLNEPAAFVCIFCVLFRTCKVLEG